VFRDVGFSIVLTLVVAASKFTPAAAAAAHESSMSKINKATKKFAQKKQKGQAQFNKKHHHARKPSAGELAAVSGISSTATALLGPRSTIKCSLRGLCLQWVIMRSF
jgi:hypothetical protein